MSSMNPTMSLAKSQDTLQPEDFIENADLAVSSGLSSNDPNMQLAPEEGPEESTNDLNESNIDYLGDLEDEAYLSRPNSRISMWMSHRRAWEGADRTREKEAAFKSYTSGIWEFDEEPTQRSYAYYDFGSWGRRHGCYFADDDYFINQDDEY
ncbi:hypothetical protein BBP40_009760 [Aspergillus hancockii]|nr:hypothetical protein BBP40_009760 [Aspergillus hancockii]